MRQATRRLLAYGSNASIVTVAVIIAVSLAYMLADSYRSRSLMAS